MSATSLSLAVDAEPLQELIDRLVAALPLPAFESVLEHVFDCFLSCLERSSLDVLEGGRTTASGARDCVIRLGIGRLSEFVTAACIAAERDSVHGVALVVKSFSGDFDSTAGAAPPLSVDVMAASSELGKAA